MLIRSYNQELAIANLLFMRIFNNISIEHSFPNGESKLIKVNCVLGNRSRIIKNFENAEKKAIYKLPMISISRTGIARNAERLNDLNNEVKYEMTSKYRRYDLMTPVPVDISYELTIYSKYPSDIDQIASNFMVFFNNDIFVSCEHPKYHGIMMNNQVVMQDSVTEEHPSELESSTDDFITATFQFTFKTFLFGGTDKAYAGLDGLSNMVSTYISTWIVTNDDGTSSLVSAELSTDTGTVYDGFTPIIKSLNVGFYAVPSAQEDIVAYMSSVDNYPNAWPYVDRFIWKIDQWSSNEFPDNVYPFPKYYPELSSFIA